MFTSMAPWLMRKRRQQVNIHSSLVHRVREGFAERLLVGMQFRKLPVNLGPLRSERTQEGTANPVLPLTVTEQNIEN
jgi:hypothetical protein